MEAQLQLYASDSNVLISRYLNKVALALYSSMDMNIENENTIKKEK
jgi:hypothetical protein